MIQCYSSYKKLLAIILINTYIYAIIKIIQSVYRNIFLLSVILYLTFSCSEDNDVINHPPIANFEISDKLDTYYLISSTTDRDNDILSYEWISESEIISIENSKSQSAYFKLPALNEPKTIGLSHIVYDGQAYDTAYKSVQLPILTEIRSLGLGRILEKEISNNVDYDWYIDQGSTGLYSEINCGPTTATMALKWYNKQFSESAEDARNIYRPSGGWWGTGDIVSYLNKYSVNNYTIELNNPDSLINELEKGNIIILCLDMYYIRNSTNDAWRIDKFYRTLNKEWGHFVILKGYKLVDNQLFFEIYDSYSLGAIYNDFSLMGRGRYYRFSDIDIATNNWWNYAIIVSKESFKSSIGLDTEKIIHKYGR